MRPSHPLALGPTLTALAFALVLGAPAGAEEAGYTLVIKNHRFEPARLEIPAGRKVTLVVRNLDATAEEFDSHDLKREKIVPAGKSANLVIGPLDPGSYRFVGEVHEDSAVGEIVVK